MQKYLRFFVGMCVTVLCLYTSALAIPEDSQTVELIAFDMETAKYGDIDDIDLALYPSEIKFPTKYCDILDYIPYSGETRSDEAAVLLNTLCPEANGKFTYPEYMAAKRFAYLLRAASIPATDGRYYDNLSYIMSFANWSLTHNYVNVILQDKERFCNALTIYEQLLTNCAGGMSPKDHPYWGMLIQDMGDGFKLTAGSTTFYDYPPLGSEDTKLASGITVEEYIRQLPLCWNYLYCGFEPTGLNAAVIDDTVVISSEDLEDPLSTVITVETYDADSDVDEQQSASEGRHVATPAPSVPVDVVGDSYNITFDTTQKGILSAEKTYNLRDVIGVIALIFSGVTVIVLCIVNTVRKQKDPLYKWMR